MSLCICLHNNFLGMEVLGQNGNIKKRSWDFPGSPVVKNPLANAWDTSSIPGLGRSHMLRGN